MTKTIIAATAATVLLAAGCASDELGQAEQAILDDIRQYDGLDVWCNVAVPAWGGIEAYVSAEAGDKAEWDMPSGGRAVDTVTVARDAETAEATRSVYEKEC